MPNIKARSNKQFEKIENKIDNFASEAVSAVKNEIDPNSATLAGAISASAVDSVREYLDSDAETLGKALENVITEIAEQVVPSSGGGNGGSDSLSGDLKDLNYESGEDLIDGTIYKFPESYNFDDFNEYNGQILAYQENEDVLIGYMNANGMKQIIYQNNGNGYFYTNEDNCWFYVYGENNPVKYEGEIEFEYYEQYLKEGMEDLLKLILNFNKPQTLEKKLDSMVNNIKYLNYEIDENGDLINGNEYYLNSNVEAFLSKYSESFSIYEPNSVLNPDGPSSPAPAPNNDPIDLSKDYIFSIMFDYTNAKPQPIKELTVFASSGRYFYNSNFKKWRTENSEYQEVDADINKVNNLILKVESNSIENRDALKELLILTKNKTLEEKFNELEEEINNPVKDKVYEVVQAELKDDTDYPLLNTYSDDFFTKYADEFSTGSGTSIYSTGLGVEIALCKMDVGIDFNFILFNDGDHNECVGYLKVPEGVPDITDGWYSTEWNENANGWIISNMPAPTTASNPTLLQLGTMFISTGKEYILKDILGINNKITTIEEKFNESLKDKIYSIEEGDELVNNQSYTFEETFTLNSLENRDIYEDTNAQTVGMVSYINVYNNRLWVDVVPEPNTMSSPFGYNLITKEWEDDAYQYLPSFIFNSSATYEESDLKIILGLGTAKTSLEQKFDQYISLTELKSIVADSSDFADFQSKIANL